MEELLEQMWAELVAELRGKAEEFGAQLGVAVDDVAAYAAERTRVLAEAVGEPGFGEAVLAERDNIALKAGLRAVAEGEELDERIDAALTFTLKAVAIVIGRAR